MALILGVVAFLLGLIPFVGFLTWILGMVAVVLGIVVLARHLEGRGLAVMGMVAGVLSIIVGLSVSGGAVAGVAGGGSALPAATDASAAAPVAVASSAAAVPSTTPVAKPKPMPKPKVVLKTYSGSGDDVLHVDYSKPVIVAFSCASCSGNTTLETDSGTDTLPVNTIGTYYGRHLLNTDDGSLLTKLTIAADAHWTLKVEDPSVAVTKRVTSVGSQVAGRGDDVIYVDSGVGDVKATNKGSGNFALNAYGSDDPLPVNEIGSYSGTVPLNGPAIVQVTSDGTWSITGEQ